MDNTTQSDQQNDQDVIQSEAFSQLVSDLGIDSLPKDKQSELVIKMTEVLLKRIFLETMENLGEQGREDYEKLTVGDQATPEQVEAFFKEHINNYDEMVQKIITDFKAEMMKTE
jgi:hypothetical protein